MLTDEQKQTRKGVSKDLLGCIKEYLKFLDIVITGDENGSKLKNAVFSDKIG